MRARARVCVLQIHGVPSVNILPESSSAFVNFSRYEDANAARKGLQGKLIGGAGPLRINASDLMQEYELNQTSTSPNTLNNNSTTETTPSNPGATGGQIGLSRPTGKLETDSSEQPGLDLGDPLMEEESIEEGPLFELLGGEIFLYDTGDVVKILWDKWMPF